MVVALLACTWIGSGEHDERMDRDGDGVLGFDDCDDEDPDAWDFSQVYADADGDGRGTGDTFQTCGPAGDGQATEDGDCDDGDATVYPGATEICDGVDNDCDGTADNEEQLDFQSYWPDEDDDGYGADTGELVDCGNPSGYAPGAGDCDDTNASVNPGAIDDTCDEVDDDCDDSVDEDAGLARYYEDEDGDGYGRGDGVQACTPPDGYAEAGDDCDDGDPTAHPDAEDYCGNGVDEDCDDKDTVCHVEQADSYADADASVTGAGEGFYGWSMIGGRDVDGDGAEDLVAGAPESSGTGAVAITWGTLTGSYEVEAVSSVLTGPGTASSFGETLAWLPGADDEAVLLAASATVDYASSSYGAPHFSSVFVVRTDGSREGLSGRVTELGSELVATVEASSASVGLGSSLAGGDVDGDGVGDLFIGASGGGAMIFSGAPEGTVSPGEADFTFSSDSYDLGGSVALGDLDGDGVADVAIGDETANDSNGQIWVWTEGLSEANGVSGAEATGEGGVGDGSAGARFYGHALTITDLDQDGYGDLVVGAPGFGYDLPGAGTIVLWSGLVSWSGRSLDFDEGNRYVDGVTAQGNFGGSVAGGGDLNGDGYPDLVVGSDNHDSGRGAAHVLLGPLTDAGHDDYDQVSEVQLSGMSGSAADAVFGAEVAWSDLDGDGYDDALISSPWHASFSGAVFVFSGGPR